MAESAPGQALDRLPVEIKLLIIDRIELGTAASRSSCWNLRADTSWDARPLKALAATNHCWRDLLRDNICSRPRILVRQSDTQDGLKPGEHSSWTTQIRSALQATTTKILRCPLMKFGTALSTRHLLIDIPSPSKDDMVQTMRNPQQHTIDTITMTKFWQAVFARFDPIVLRLRAPISILGWLIGDVVYTWHSWAFDMNIQVIELSREAVVDTACSQRSALQQSQPVSSYTLIATASRRSDNNNSFLTARPWKAFQLYEGSLLPAYGTYEYYSLIPPTILRPLAHSAMDIMTEFSLHVLFPFSSYLTDSSLVALSWFTRVHFHFAPGPDEDILNDPRLVGKADLIDCWSETLQLYQLTITSPTSPLFAPNSRLEVFSTADWHVSSIAEELEAAFRRNDRNHWSRISAGCWARSVNDIVQS